MGIVKAIKILQNIVRQKVNEPFMLEVLPAIIYMLEN